MAHSASQQAAVVVVACLLSVLGIACGSQSAASESPAEKHAIAQYRRYLDIRAAALVGAIEELAGPIGKRKVPRSQSLYVIARVPYGQLAPAARSLAGLNARIDGQQQGFHEIERRLWRDGTTKRLEPVVARLLAASQDLQHQVAAVRLTPATITRGIAAELHELTSRKVTGRADPYSNADLADIAASVEGVKAAYAAIQPTLEAEGAAVQAIDKQLHETYDTLREFGGLASDPAPYRPKAAGALFVEYSELSSERLEELSQAISALSSVLMPAIAELQ